MIRNPSPRLALLMALGVFLSGTGSAPAATQATASQATAGKRPALEPRAMEILKAMSARLAAAKTVTFTAVTTEESPTRLGPPLAYSTLSEVTLQRPDKLRIVTPGDGPAAEFYVDGKSMRAFSPAKNFVAVADARPTIDASLKVAYDTAAIYFPFTDVLVADPFRDLTDGLKRAFYIGQSQVVGGTTTDMVAIANDRVFVQLWIGAEDKLPRRMRAVYLTDSARLRHEVDFSNWKLDSPVPAGTFTSARAGSAQRVPFARPDPQPPGKPAATITNKNAKSENQ
jgi:hypothetical protein